MAAVIQLRAVTKTYPGETTAALASTDLTIRRGEVTLLMGPSGSGKTTLISIMGGILRPTSGEVWIAGQEISRLSERRMPPIRLKHIGFIFQGFNLMPTLSVKENVELALSLHGVRGARARARSLELLESVGLAGKAAAFPADLSGGQKQRVAIARALSGDPDVVLADEPTAALDSASGRLVMEQFRGLAERGRAVVVVSHDNRIVEFADRIIRIEDGRISSDSGVDLLEDSMSDSLEADESAHFSKPHRLPQWLAVLPLLATVSIATRSWHPTAAVAAAPAAAKAIAAAILPPAVPKVSLVAAAGRVEPMSDEVKIGSPVAGRLRVLIKEGQVLSAGQVIAMVENRDLAARLAQAEAGVALRNAELRKVESGTTAQERQSAEVAVKEARALLQSAQAEAGQRKSLLASGDVSRAELERSLREVNLAEIRLSKAMVTAEAAKSPARVHDLEGAKAQVDAAKAQVDEARALLERTVVRAPFAGVVLKRYRRTGEDVGPGGDPIISFGDTSRLAVRMDLDEADVGKIKLGDLAYCTAQAFGNRRFAGRVVQISQQLGRKNIETGDPAEKVDTRVLETLIALDGKPQLPVGLRVVAFVESR